MESKEQVKKTNEQTNEEKKLKRIKIRRLDEVELTVIASQANYPAPQM